MRTHRARARMGLRCLTVRVSDRTVRHLISTGAAMALFFAPFGPEEIFGSREVLRALAIDRKLLAEADYGPVDFERGTR